MPPISMAKVISHEYLQIRHSSNTIDILENSILYRKITNDIVTITFKDFDVSDNTHLFFIIYPTMPQTCEDANYFNSM